MRHQVELLAQVGRADYVIRQHGDNGPGWRLTDIPKSFPNAYQVEHDELFASIRDGKPINAGQRVPNSAMMAILGRMAGYTGQVVTWKQATESKEDLMPKELDLKAAMPTRRWRCRGRRSWCNDRKPVDRSFNPIPGAPTGPGDFRVRGFVPRRLGCRPRHSFTRLHGRLGRHSAGQRSGRLADALAVAGAPRGRGRMLPGDVRRGAGVHAPCGRPALVGVVAAGGHREGGGPAAEPVPVAWRVDDSADADGVASSRPGPVELVVAAELTERLRGVCAAPQGAGRGVLSPRVVRVELRRDRPADGDVVEHRVGVTIHRARKRLRELLGEGAPEQQATTGGVS